mmetsp:Transcript_22351/g.31296  ORF Transcript_22351/g.31296 Transcript_22351/m.31296 type:complete len:406 (+) Transcript_22351:127-1344(+)|eukprot:CAMPEP_0184499908 /NCGR_PEP_ID=MMETSP0113_2-20130426/42946_1 /TAXON_ID=91329 /ORGANISM="Norrisiella sphaerica, Strain BC52" /LENGTH=405 /DNA_ID=CAMNT_0026888023 /DNA_START=84 /DNA_END=1301 /DNA_ORIENTATION=+
MLMAQKLSERFVLDFIENHPDVAFLRSCEQSIRKCRRRIELNEILELCALGWDLQTDLKAELSQCVALKRSFMTKEGKGETHGLTYSFTPLEGREDCCIKHPGLFSIKFETNRGYQANLSERLTVRVQCSSSKATGIVYQFTGPRRDPSLHIPMLQRFLSATRFPKHVFMPFLILGSKEMGASKGHVLPRKQIQRFCRELEGELGVEGKSRSSNSDRSWSPASYTEDRRSSATRSHIEPQIFSTAVSPPTIDDSTSDDSSEDESGKHNEPQESRPRLGKKRPREIGDGKECQGHRVVMHTEESDEDDSDDDDEEEEEDEDGDNDDDDDEEEEDEEEDGERETVRDSKRKHVARKSKRRKANKTQRVKNHYPENGNRRPRQRSSFRRQRKPQKRAITRRASASVGP